jgi:hypothetical protein
MDSGETISEEKTTSLKETITKTIYKILVAYVRKNFHAFIYMESKLLWAQIFIVQCTGVILLFFR